MRRDGTVWRIGAVALLLAGAVVCFGQLPIFSAGGPDAAAYGAADHYPVGTASTMFEKKYMVGAFSHFDTFFPVHDVLPASKAWDFQRPGAPPQITYFHAGTRYAIGDYLQHLPVTGLLIAKGDEIRFEAYQYARTDHDRLTSQSMAKSIVSMLVGIAISEHAIQSVNDKSAQYVSELKGSDYGKVSLRDLLHMSSGVTCTTSDEELENVDIKLLAGKCKQEAPEGTRFRYSAADSAVLGLVVERAVKMPLARYLQERIWQKIGTESKAAWTINEAGNETAYCCFNATLRDYTRFGRLLASDGAWNGQQLIPQKWLLDATTVSDSDPQLMPGKSVPFFGYGYQVWVFPGPRRMFALLGANGQRIFIDPGLKLVMVQTAVMEKNMDQQKDKEMIGLWLSLVHQYLRE